MATGHAIAYDPDATFEVDVTDVDYLTVDGKTFFARIYQPKGDGPFPTLLDIHGGAWSGSDRLSNETVDLAVASSGCVVASIDFRVAPEHPYPAQVADANYAVRWLKAHATEYNGSSERFGVIGRSSGGHTALLLALRPSDPRYSAIPHEGDPAADYYITMWPVLDSWRRYVLAKERGAQDLVTKGEGYFITEEAMQEGNPQQILERGEEVTLPPVQIIHGSADVNVPLYLVEQFEENYRRAGGHVELEVFPDQPHTFAADPGPATDDAVERMKAFIARQVTG